MAYQPVDESLFTTASCISRYPEPCFAMQDDEILLALCDSPRK